jgi:hypothetical protein
MDILCVVDLMEIKITRYCLNGKKTEWNIQWDYLFIILEPKKLMMT